MEQTRMKTGRKMAPQTPLYYAGKQALHLRGLGHHLSPVAMLGKEGITEQLVKSVDTVLTAHELVKVKVQNTCPLGRREAAEVLAKKTGSGIAQIIGKTFLLYRENKDRKEDRKIRLPEKKQP